MGKASLNQMLNRRCPRCNSAMLYEKFFHETEYVWGWKCLFCGEYIDQVVSENRQYQKKIQGDKRKQFLHVGSLFKLRRFF